MEETGILATEDDLMFLGTYQDYKESNFVDIFLLHRDISISRLTMQDGETTAAKWINLDQLELMISNQSLAFPIGIRFTHVKKRLLKKLETLSQKANYF